jgi:hypothetical protein
MDSLEILSPRPDSHRINHPDLGDVHKTTYAEGLITDMGVISANPLMPADTCTVECGEKEFENVPLFFHCRQDSRHPEGRTPRDNKGLQNAAWGYRAGDRVKVMLQEGEAAAVLGLADNPVKAPGDFDLRRCPYLVRVVLFARLTMYPLPSGTWESHFVYLDLITQTVYHHHVQPGYVTGSNQPIYDSWGHDMEEQDPAYPSYKSPYWCKLQARRILYNNSGPADDTLAHSDYLVIIGPAMYIWRLTSRFWKVGPNPDDERFSTDLEIYAAIYAKERTNEVLALGTANSGQGVSAAPGYPGFVSQAGLTQLVKTGLGVRFGVWAPPEDPGGWVEAFNLTQQPPQGEYPLPPPALPYYL